MIDLCRSCLHLFDSHYVSEITSGNIVVAERNPGGAGEAIFRTDKPCVLIRPKHNIAPIWSLIRKSCADGAFFLFDKNEVRLHIVELKSIVRFDDWTKARGQIEGMFLAALAVGRLLHVHEVAHVTCYLVLKEDRITVSKSETASPILLKGPVGESETFGREESWNKGIVKLPHSVTATLVKGWKNDAGKVEFSLV